MKFFVFAPALFLITMASALGINCKGSSACAGCAKGANIRHLVSMIPDDGTYKNQQQIVCTPCYVTSSKGGLCIFPQHLPEDMTVTGKEVKHHLEDLFGFGCKACGSVPVFPDNNVKDGEITINYVSNSCAANGRIPKLC